jgi:hypothetical protein
VFLLAGSLAANRLADLRSSATAMACCLKANNQCAGLSAPDDCCKRMGHTASATVAGTLPTAQPVGVPAIAIAPLSTFDASFGPASTNSDFAFKRPHDPPHLHPYSLLI